MSESVHKHRESAPEHVRVAVLTISDTRTPETDTGGDTIEELMRTAGHEVVRRGIVRDEAARIRTELVDNLWRVPQQSGEFRYYQESVYLLGLLSVAGKFNHEW